MAAQKLIDLTVKKGIFFGYHLGVKGLNRPEGEE